ncbi:uncharacterized protein METZ01_LOCUS459250, partial [marine metagenome]
SVLSAFRFRLGSITNIWVGFLPKAPNLIPSGSGLTAGDGSGRAPSIGTPIQDKVTSIAPTKQRGYISDLTILPRTLNFIGTLPKNGCLFYLRRT